MHAPEEREKEFLTRWQQRRIEFDRLRASVDAALLIDALLAELEDVWRGRDATVLTLAEASAESGYSAEHLGRLMRNGKLVNVGRRHAPRIRRGDLPRKRSGQNGALTSASRLPYDVTADARSLRDVRRGEYE